MTITIHFEDSYYDFDPSLNNDLEEIIEQAIEHFKTETDEDIDEAEFTYEADMHELLDHFVYTEIDEQLFEAIEYLEGENINLDYDYDLMTLYNNACDSLNYPDDRVYSMDDFEEIISGFEALDLVSRVLYGDFNPHHNYFTFNGNGNLESSEYLGTLIDNDTIISFLEKV